MDAASCLLCLRPCDRTKEDLVLLTCEVEGCDRDAPYHADCSRELYSSAGALKCGAFVPRPYDSTQTLEHRDCYYDKGRRYLCVHSVSNEGNKRFVDAYTGCRGRVVASSLQLRKKAAPPAQPPQSGRPPPARALPSKAPPAPKRPAVEPLLLRVATPATPAPRPKPKPAAAAVGRSRERPAVNRAEAVFLGALKCVAALDDHEFQPPSPPARNPWRDVCHYDAHGGCANGAACRFVHSAPARGARPDHVAAAVAQFAAQAERRAALERTAGVLLEGMARARQTLLERCSALNHLKEENEKLLAEMRSPSHVALAAAASALGAGPWAPRPALAAWNGGWSAARTAAEVCASGHASLLAAEAAKVLEGARARLAACGAPGLAREVERLSTLSIRLANACSGAQVVVEEAMQENARLAEDARTLRDFADFY